jgi:hypothetical protein
MAIKVLSEETALTEEKKTSGRTEIHRWLKG